MKPIHSLAIVLFVTHAALSAEHNPAIDYSGFLADATTVESLRENRRIDENEFLRMAAEPGTVVLDARSSDRFTMRHVEGAVNLPLPDFAEDSLARVIPSKTTRILIYCNNNFGGDPLAMVRKTAPAALNIYTFNALHAYGYRNVYELAPLRDLSESKLSFAGTHAASTPDDSAVPSARSAFDIPRPVQK